MLGQVRRRVAAETARALQVPIERVQLVEHRAPSGIAVQAVYWPEP